MFAFQVKHKTLRLITLSPAIDAVDLQCRHFNISKSTVHKDVSERLKDIDEELYERARAVSDKNLSERHIRGGIATRQKYLKTEKAEKQ